MTDLPFDFGFVFSELGVDTRVISMGRIRCPHIFITGFHSSTRWHCVRKTVSLDSLLHGIWYSVSLLLQQHVSGSHDMRGGHETRDSKIFQSMVPYSAVNCSFILRLTSMKIIHRCSLSHPRHASLPLQYCGKAQAEGAPSPPFLQSIHNLIWRCRIQQPRSPPLGRRPCGPSTIDDHPKRVRRYAL